MEPLSKLSGFALQLLHSDLTVFEKGLSNYIRNGQQCVAEALLSQRLSRCRGDEGDKVECLHLIAGKLFGSRADEIIREVAFRNAEALVDLIEEETGAQPLKPH